MVFFQDGSDEHRERFQQLSFGEIKIRSRRRKNRKHPHHILVSLERQMHGSRLWPVIGKLACWHLVFKGPLRDTVFLFVKRKRAGRMPFRGQRMVWEPEQKRSAHAEERLRETDRC